MNKDVHSSTKMREAKSQNRARNQSFVSPSTSSLKKSYAHIQPKVSCHNKAYNRKSLQSDYSRKNHSFIRSNVK